MNNSDWYSANMATFGDRLTGAREAAHWSHEALALRLGVRVATIHGWENDHAEPRGNRLQMLCGMLNVSLRWMLTGEGDGVNNPFSQEPKDIRHALADLTRMRAQMLAMSQDLRHLETRVRSMIQKADL